MGLFHPASMADKVIEHTNAQSACKAAKDTWRVALQAYEEAMAELPTLPAEVMNSQKTRQRMIELKRASDGAWNAFYKAKAAERKAFDRLAS